MSLCIEKVAAMECNYTNDVARCDVDMNGTCQLDAGVFCRPPLVRLFTAGTRPLFWIQTEVPICRKESCIICLGETCL